MNYVVFSKYATFLSGRSLPKEILEKEITDPKQVVVLDFANIPAANQSFLNQLFLELEKFGYDPDTIKIVNASTSALSDRISEQVDLIFGCHCSEGQA